MALPLIALAALAGSAVLNAMNTRRTARAQQGLAEAGQREVEALQGQRLQVLKEAADGYGGAAQTQGYDQAEANALSQYAAALNGGRQTAVEMRPAVWTGGGRASDAFLQYRGQQVAEQQAENDDYAGFLATVRGNEDARFDDRLRLSRALNLGSMLAEGARQRQLATQAAVQSVRPNTRMALAANLLGAAGSAGLGAGGLGGAAPAATSQPLAMSPLGAFSPVTNTTPLQSTSNGFFANALRGGK
jgi:hypothetical protein